MAIPSNLGPILTQKITPNVKDVEKTKDEVKSKLEDKEVIKDSNPIISNPEQMPEIELLTKNSKKVADDCDPANGIECHPDDDSNYCHPDTGT